MGDVVYHWYWRKAITQKVVIDASGVPKNLWHVVDALWLYVGTRLKKLWILTLQNFMQRELVGFKFSCIFAFWRGWGVGVGGGWGWSGEVCWPPTTSHCRPLPSGNLPHKSFHSLWNNLFLPELGMCAQAGKVEQARKQTVTNRTAKKVKQTKSPSSSFFVQSFFWLSYLSLPMQCKWFLICTHTRPAGYMWT